MLGQKVIALTHQPEKDVEEVDAIEDDCIMLDVVDEVLLKMYRMLSPVHGLLLVVRNMVAIIPALVVVLRIDAGDAVSVFVFRLARADKSMLRPVAHHRNEAINAKRQNKNDEGGLPIEKAKSGTKEDEENFAAHRPHHQTLSFLANKIVGQMVDAGEKEA